MIEKQKHAKNNRIERKQVTASKFQHLLETSWIEETILAFCSDSVRKTFSSIKVNIQNNQN